MDETRTTAVRFPPGRYGRRRERNGRRLTAAGPSRWFVAVGISVVIVAGVAIAVGLYDQYGRQEYTGNVLAFDTHERAVTVNFEVFKPEGVGATCLVRARSKDGAAVGHAEVAIPEPGTRATVEYTLETSARPVTGELVRCFPPR